MNRNYGLNSIIQYVLHSSPKYCLPSSICAACILVYTTLLANENHFSAWDTLPLFYSNTVNCSERNILDTWTSAPTHNHSVGISVLEDSILLLIL